MADSVDPIVLIISEHLHSHLYMDTEYPLHIPQYNIGANMSRYQYDPLPAFLKCVNHSKFETI